MLLEIDNKPFLQFILILSLCLISVILFSIIGGLITFFAYGIEGLDINNLGNPNTIKGLKILQLFTAGGLFVVAPIVYALISSNNILEKLSLRKIKKPISYLLMLLLMIVFTPFMSWIIEVNANVALPEFMADLEQWFKIKQGEALATQEAFLTFDGTVGLIYVIVLIVIIPAFGEEFLFRGVLQKIFIKWTKNHHLGILITAFLFGLLHMQFYSFFPIMLLGVVFGYVFYWSKSLWLPILGHFFNNGSVLVATIFFPESLENTDLTIFEENEYRIAFYVVSFILSAIIFYFIRKMNHKRVSDNENNTAISV